MGVSLLLNSLFRDTSAEPTPVTLFYSVVGQIEDSCSSPRPHPLRFSVQPSPHWQETSPFTLTFSLIFLPRVGHTCVWPSAKPAGTFSWAAILWGAKDNGPFPRLGHMEHVAGVLWEGGAGNIIASTCLKGLDERVCKQRDWGLGFAPSRYQPGPSR